MNILYVHDFGSSSSDKWFQYINEAKGEHKLYALDISIYPYSAIGYVKSLIAEYLIDVVITVGLGAFILEFVEKGYGIKRIYINPNYEIYNTLTKEYDSNKKYEYKSTRYDKEKYFVIDDKILKHIKYAQMDFKQSEEKHYEINTKSNCVESNIVKELENILNLVNSEVIAESKADKQNRIEFLNYKKQSMPFVTDMIPNCYYPALGDFLTKYYGIEEPKIEIEDKPIIETPKSEETGGMMFGDDFVFVKPGISYYEEIISIMLKEKGYCDDFYSHNMAFAVSTDGLIGIDFWDVIRIILDGTSFGYKVQKVKDINVEEDIIIDNARNILVLFKGNNNVGQADVFSYSSKIQEQIKPIDFVRAFVKDENLKDCDLEIIYLYSNYSNDSNTSEGIRALIEQNEKYHKSFSV